MLFFARHADLEAHAPPCAGGGTLPFLALVLAAASAACAESIPARGLLALHPDEVESVEILADRWRLSDGGRTRIVLELPQPATLRIEGTTKEDGELTLDLEERSREDGRALGRRSVQVRARGGRLGSKIELEAPHGVLSLGLAWSSSADSPLDLVRMELGEPPRERVPIIFFSIDTLAAGHTSLHGYSRATTPNLEKLAAESVVFDRCLANAPYTWPSYASQLTGLSPRSNWVDPSDFKRLENRPPKKYETYHVPPERWTLAESLRAAGYRTAAFVDNPLAGPAFGFDQGFELYDMSAQKIPVMDPDGGIRTIVPKALDWIDALPSGEPFFLFVNVLDVHGPYAPPPEFRGRFGSGSGEPSAELPVCGDGDEVFGAIPSYAARALAKKPLPEQLPVDPMVALYDEEILFVDAVLAEFVEALRERGILDRSVLVITADHGEALSEGDYKFGHGVPVQENLHVPLVLRLPAGHARGLRVSEPVELLDLYPTLVELAGLAPRDYLHGRSLLPLCRGESLPPRCTMHEGGLLESTAVTEGDWRLVEWRFDAGAPRTRYSLPAGRRLLAELAPELYRDLWGPGDVASFLSGLERNRKKVARMDEKLGDVRVRELYDLSEDPHQLVDVSSEHPDVVARLGRVMDEGHERSRLARARLGARATEIPASLDSELRDLGYAGDTEE